MFSRLNRDVFRRFDVRTMLGFASLLTVAVLVVFLAFWYGLERSLERETDEVLEGDVRQFIYHLTQSGWDEEVLRKELEHETASRSEHEVFYRVFDASGAARWTIPPALSGRCLPSPEEIRSVLAAHRQHLRHSRADRPDSISVLYPVPAQDGRFIGCQVGISLGQVQERMAKYAYVFVGVGFAVVAVGGVASYRLLRRPLKRMQAIAAEAARITASNLDRRLPDSHSGDEFDELARTLNVMLDRLAASVQSLERFAGDAAHELRGPVARLRAAADIALESDRLSDADARAALGDIGEHADELSRLIKDLLFLAREEGGTPAAQQETIDAPSLLEEVVSLYEGPAEDKGVCLRLARADAATLRGHRQRLLRAIGNLVDNAIRFTMPGGRVEVSGAIDEVFYRFSVSDTGCGIAPEHLPHAFDRFSRGDPARASGGGTGLGLSIVRAIARSHGGDVSVASEPDKGSLFTLTVPRAR